MELVKRNIFCVEKIRFFQQKWFFCDFFWRFQWKWLSFVIFFGENSGLFLLNTSILKKKNNSHALQKYHENVKNWAVFSRHESGVENCEREKNINLHTKL